MLITKSLPTSRRRIRSTTLSDAQQKKAIAAWRGVRGIWADTKQDPLDYQRSMRRERKLPRP